eukprot:CAMPEP_0171241372 /NCGR_PEP_ID=MMETSP0790-20130122/45050_1 /TAXON_ID=2925 /ORGANISM="Alexandrium catenella, Strain OF101" /LENGTH=207 /DNA_ID=CAMNT_0011707957 /DNA_START=105 /DNA_END=725 /DNA_ORIENTATION=-
MTANAGLAALVAKHRGVPLTGFGMACCGLYAAYGTRLSAFLLRRKCDESYAPKFQTVQLKSDQMSFGSRFALVAGVSFSQALYALPLSVATSPAAASAAPVLKTLGWVGVGGRDRPPPRAPRRRAEAGGQAAQPQRSGDGRPLRALQAPELLWRDALPLRGLLLRAPRGLPLHGDGLRRGPAPDGLRHGQRGEAAGPRGRAPLRRGP